MSKTPEDSPVRTFLAIEIPPALRADLASLGKEFFGHTSILKWVSSDLLHITVRFLGNLFPARVARVCEVAEEITTTVPPFSLSLSGLGAFPTERSPRVVWMGLKHDAGFQRLDRLHRELENALVARGFAPENRDFSPHITLARTRDVISPGERQRLGETLARVKARCSLSERFPVVSLVVMRSDLGREGPTYTPLVRAVLQGSRNE